MTDDIASALGRFPGLIARSHHLLDGSDSEDIDPNLGEIADVPLVEGGPPRLRFMLFSSLPSDALIRRLTLQTGSRLALSGRIVIDGDELDLALNLWEVEPGNLLWCRTEFGERETMLATLRKALVELGSRLGVSDIDELTAATDHVLGTDSFDAYDAHAAAVDRIRRASLEDREPRHRSVAQALMRALELDPGYAAPRRLMFEHARRRLAARDRSTAQALAAQLPNLAPRRIEFDLLTFESLLITEGKAAAAQWLDELEDHWIGDDRIARARERIRGG